MWIVPISISKIKSIQKPAANLLNHRLLSVNILHHAKIRTLRSTIDKNVANSPNAFRRVTNFQQLFPDTQRKRQER